MLVCGHTGTKPRRRTTSRHNRRSCSISCPEGGASSGHDRSFEQVTLLRQARVLTAQPAQLVALIAAQAVVAFVAIDVVLAAPVPERLLRHTKAGGELARGAAGAHH